ncbi:aminopeptidase N-like [Nylanderia fulva]|uniref:aminopeptidase N-like n=1 Tax=Nylanderia fulva TaxID=613905 RepID=UPI0010FACEFC|nr:aminopeptidase N-like [Nylanderia fulva]
MEEKTTWIGAPHFQIIGPQPLFSHECLHLHDLGLKATFTISIRCKRCTALSSMPLQKTDMSEHNMLWLHFDTSPITWTDHATMIVSNYLFRDYKTRNIKMWCRFNTKYHMEFAKYVAEKITSFFKNEWKHSDYTSIVSHIAIPNFHDRSTYFGLVLYRETDIVYVKNIYPIARKIEVAQLVGRKVTQQWFNNIMNNALVSDFWFKNGLITLLAMHVINKAYPNYRIINLFVVQNQHYSFNLDSDYHMWNFTSQVNSSLEIPKSIRAPFILRMMQHVFTEEIFWKGIRSYVNTIQFHRDSFVHFWREVVDAAEKTNISLKTMNYWDMEKHCPIIKVIRNYNTNEVNVSIQNIDTLRIDCLPVTFSTEASANFNNFTHHMVCVSKDLKLSLPYKEFEYNWIIFNIQQIGYYRVNYNDENWRRISKYLCYVDYTKIHVLNRAQIIDDAFHFMIAGQLHSTIFFHLISYLHLEEDYIAWYPMFKALEYMYSSFPAAMLESGVWNFKKFISSKLYNVLERITYEENDDNDELRKCLRQEAARWACFLGNYYCKKEANNKLKQHIEDPKTHGLLPWWKEWTYCNGLMTTTKKETTWQSVYNIGFKKSDTKFLEYLACSEDTNIIINYLNHTIYYEQYNFTENEYQYLFNSFLHIFAKHTKNPIILEYILHHLDEIKPKNVNIIAVLIIIINNVYSKNRTEQILRNIRDIIEYYLIELHIKDKYFRRRKYYYQIKEMSNFTIDKDYLKLYYQIIEQIKIRNKQIERQSQYIERLFH